MLRHYAPLTGLMAAFPPGAEWSETLSEPVLLDGTVEEIAPAFDALLVKRHTVWSS